MPDDRTLRLLPTSLHVERETAARLAAEPAVAASRLSAIGAFERRLADGVVGAGFRVAPLTARLLVRAVLREAYPDERQARFHALRHSGRFADSLRDLFGRLVRGLVTPARFSALRVPAGEPRRAATHAELAELYSAYVARLDRLERGHPDARRGGVIETLGHLSLPPRPLRDVDRLEVLDRDRWLPSDAALLAALARFVPVEVHLPAPIPGRERLFAVVARSASVLADAARAAGTPLRVVRERLCGGPGTAAPLADLCARLFAPADEPPADPLDPARLREALAIIDAPGRREEVRAVVGEVRRALEAGTPPDEIAIAARDLGRYDRLLVETLEAARVPYRFRRGIPLLATPLVRTALACLALPARRFDIEGVAGLFAGSYASLDGDRPGRLERVLLEAGRLEGTPAEYRESLEALARRREAAGAGGDAALVRRVAGALVPHLERLASLDRPAPLAAHAAAVRRLLADLGVVARARAGDDRRVAQDAAALAALDEGLDEMRRAEAESGEATPVPFEVFRDLLESVLAERFVEPPGSRRAEAVRVVAASDMAGLRFDLVCLLGLVEGEFPRRPPLDPVLHDRDLEALALLLAPDGPFETAAEVRAVEPFLLYRVLTAARRRLVLSSPAEDDQGRPLLHSSFLEAVARAIDPAAAALDPLAPLRTPALRHAPGRAPAPARFDDCLSPAEAEARLAWLSAADPVTAARRAAAEALDPAVVEAALSADPAMAARLAARRAVAARLAAQDRFFATPPGETRTALVGPSTGALASPEARAALRAALAPGGEVWLSASALEMHARCAYQWFLSYGVRLRPLDRPRRDLEDDQAGTLLHTVLEAGYAACLREGLVPIGGPADPEAARALGVMLHAARSVAAEWEGFGPGVPRAVREAEVARLEATVRAFVRDEASRAADGFVPVAFEHAFGTRRDGAPAAADPVRIPLGDGLTAVVRGQVDRIDWGPAEGRLRCVDYKRSADSKAYKARLEPEALGERSFQMPIYLLAAEALLRAEPDRFPGATLAGREAAYHLLRRTPDLQRRVLDDDGYFALDAETREARLAAGAPNFANQLAARVRRWLEGPYEITPEPDEGCGFCPFGGVCRVVTPLPVGLP